MLPAQEAAITPKRQRLSTAGAWAGNTVSGMASAEGMGGADDLVAYMTSRGGKIAELEEEVIALRKSAAEATAQLTARDSELSSLRTQLASWRAVKDAEAASLTASNKQLAEQLAQEMARGHGTDAQLKRVRQEAAAAKAEAASTATRLADAQAAATAAIAEAQQRCCDLSEQLTAAQREAAEGIRAAHTALALERERAAAAAEAAQLSAQAAADARAALSDMSERAAAAEASAAAAEGRAVRAEANTAAMAGSDAQVLLRTLQEQLVRQSAALTDARRDAAAAAALPGLRQQLADTQADARNTRRALEELQAAQPGVDALREELQLWRAAVKSALGLEHPSPAALSALQARQQQLDRQRHDAQVELTTLKAEAVELRAALAEAEASAASSTGELHALRSALSAAQLELRLVRSEADGLRRLVLLLEQEQNNGGTETSTAVLGDTKVTPAVPNDGVAPMDASDGGAAATTMPTDSAAAAARAAALESLVAELQAAREQLQTQLADATQAEAELRGAEAAAQVELRKRERELESMAAAVDALQARLAGGEYDPTRTRVLHVAANPASELARLQDKAALERLEEENRQLRVALAAAATGSSEPNAAATDAAAAAGGEAGVAAAVATAEVRLLTRKLAAAEKQAGALRDVFKQRVKAFRDSCRALFGYRVDMVSDPWADVAHAPTTYTLTSCFGPRDDVLMFRYHPQANPQYSLLPTPTSRRLAAEVGVFLDAMGCIPAFTANHTMTLHQAGGAQAAAAREEPALGSSGDVAGGGRDAAAAAAAAAEEAAEQPAVAVETTQST